MAPNQLAELHIGDEPSAWAEAGFAVDGDTVVIGTTAIVLRGPGSGRGITAMALNGQAAGDLDGLCVVDLTRAVPDRLDHRNGVTAFDHLVVMTPDADRTTAAFEAASIEARRVRTFEAGGATRRQTFFWWGDVILELVGDDERHDEGPASAWGLAFTTPDLDRTVASLGVACGAAKDAVQPGRRIATMKTGPLDISVPIALMTPHPGAAPA